MEANESRRDTGLAEADGNEANVVLVRFPDRSRAEEAMRRVRMLADDGALVLRGGAVVEREPTGRLVVVDEADPHEFEATIAGGLVGALLGALAGPAGLLAGGTAGVVVGSLADERQADQPRVAMGAMSDRVPPGGIALVADVGEPAPRVLDQAFGGLDAHVSRWARAEIEAELSSPRPPE